MFEINLKHCILKLISKRKNFIVVCVRLKNCRTGSYVNHMYLRSTFGAHSTNELVANMFRVVSCVVTKSILVSAM
jgi:hypothetical protein